MVMIIFSRRGLMEWEKKRYAEILKKLIPEIRRFNGAIGIFNDNAHAEIRIRFK